MISTAERDPRFLCGVCQKPLIQCTCEVLNVLV